MHWIGLGIGMAGLFIGSGLEHLGMKIKDGIESYVKNLAIDREIRWSRGQEISRMTGNMKAMEDANER